MATRTVSPTGGNWSSATTWLEGAVPTDADDVVLNALSGPLTIDVAGSCKSFDASAYTGTLTHGSNQVITIGANGTNPASGAAFRLSAAMTYILNSAANQGWTFGRTSGTATIDTAGKTMPGCTFGVAASSASNWQLNSALTLNTGTIVHTGGTFNTNGMAVTCAVYNSSNSTTRTANWGSSTITLTGSSALTMVNTGHTLNAGTSTLVFTGTGGTQAFNTLPYANVVLNVPASTTSQTVTGTAPTFVNFTINGGAHKAASVQLSSIASLWAVSGTLTITGNSAVNRLVVFTSTPGFTGRGFSAATAVLQDVDFMDVQLGGTAAGTGGTRLGDGGGNVGITFTPSATQYWVGGTGSWSDPNKWASSSGGAGGTGRVPLPQDDVRVDASSVTAGGQTITMDMYRLGRNVDFTGVANNPTVIGSGVSTIHGGLSIFGSLTLAPDMTWSTGSGNNMAMRGRGSHTINAAGKGFPFTGNRGMTFFAPGGSYTLASALTLNSAGLATTNNFVLHSGTFDTAGFALTTGNQDYSISGAGTRAVYLRSSTVTITNDGAVFTLSSTTGVTFDAGTSLIDLTATTIISKTVVAASGARLNHLRDVSNTTAALIFTHPSTITTLTVTGPKPLVLSAGNTVTVTNLTVSGAQLGYLRLDGTSSTRAETVDHARYDAMTELELVMRLSMDDWTPAATNMMMAKYNTGSGADRSFRWYITSAGTPTLGTNTAGTDVTAVPTASAVVSSMPNGGTLWLKVTWRGSDGRVQYFTAPDTGSNAEPASGAWTQMGSNRVGAIGTLVNSTKALQVGEQDGSFNLAGNVYRAIMRTTIDGPAVFDFDATKQRPAARSITEDANGATVTLGGRATFGGIRMESSTPGTRATVKREHLEIEVEYVHMSDIQATGGTARALDSTDATNNAGWLFRDRVPVDLVGRWDARALVADEAELRWAARHVVAEDLGVAWGARHAAAAELDVEWAARGFVGDDLELDWSERGTVADVAELDWDTRAVVLEDTDLRWMTDVKPTLLRIRRESAHRTTVSTLEDAT